MPGVQRSGPADVDAIGGRTAAAKHLVGEGSLTTARGLAFAVSDRPSEREAASGGIEDKPMPCVRTGLDALVADDFTPLRGQRVGLVANAATVDASLRHAVDLFANCPHLKLTALFGPEHGLFGQAQDLIGVPGQHEPRHGIVVHSLYGSRVESLKPSAQQLQGLDTLVIDVPDIGCRYYTFAATMLMCLEAAAAVGLPTVVLDRPNPLGGEVVEGPAPRQRFRSFVGYASVATRHGLTLGELARWYAAEHGLTDRLRVIQCEGWQRGMTFDQTGLPWVMPSPNMPTLDTAFVYPGQCLLEGTNLSEGRGTTRPFELCGAPWLDPQTLADRLRDEKLPGVVFRPTYFQPTFHKFARQTCGGVQVHVTDRALFQPVRTGLTVLAVMRALSGSRFAWRSEPYEFVADIPAIDLLLGSDRERLGLEAGMAPAELTRAWRPEEQEFRERRLGCLLYR
jgi:uncharacterized protein YbbC (DUF1343 family)